MIFDVFLEIYSSPFFVSMMIHDSIVAKRVHRNCYDSISREVSYVDLVELDM